MINDLKAFKLTREVSPSLPTIQSSFSANLFTSIRETNTSTFYCSYHTELYRDKNLYMVMLFNFFIGL